MQRVVISQIELDQGNGRFNEYMRYVIHCISAKSTASHMAFFAAALQISQEGFQIRAGSDPDDAGISVANWIKNYYGARTNISYCYPPIAYQLSGHAYLLRMPVVREKEMLVSQAVIDLTPDVAADLSGKQIAQLQREFSEFHDALDVISKLDITTVIHLEASAQRIFDGAAHYALSRWESLHFIERAMKEVLMHLGSKETKAAGHDIKGKLHQEWVKFGIAALPINLLDDVMCSPSIRYEKSPHPFLATLRAHHSSIRLGAIIANHLPSLPPMGDEMSVSMKDIAREGTLAIARLNQALHRLPQQPIRLVQDSSSN